MSEYQNNGYVLSTLCCEGVSNPCVDVVAKYLPTRCRHFKNCLDVREKLPEISANTLATRVCDTSGSVAYTSGTVRKRRNRRHFVGPANPYDGSRVVGDSCETVRLLVQ